jgi:hypothetical protein
MEDNQCHSAEEGIMQVQLKMKQEKNTAVKKGICYHV